MSLWDRYLTWRPEENWDRYQAWRFESRTRFVATGVGVRAFVVFFLSLFLGSSPEAALRSTSTIVVLAVVVWWFWYPRAKRKSKLSSALGRPTPAWPLRGISRDQQNS